jgi:hypothetical protein
VTTVLISTDEAGYGPNLGPLLIAGTSWAVENSEEDLFELLKDAVSSQADTVGKRLVIADSKQIFRAGNLAALEQSVLAILHAVTGAWPQSLEDLIQLVSPALSNPNLDGLRQQGWLKNVELSFPVVADLATIERLSQRFLETCQRASVRLRAVECKVLFSDEFNRELNTFGNKANLLSSHTLELVKLLLEQAAAEQPVRIGCDKHGGRNKYAALVQHFLEPEFVRVVRESLEVSEYEFQHRGRSVSMRFAARGESFLPTALSSMVAKYLREVIMLGWNQFWLNELPKLRPTQGYPQDAKRFLQDINAVRGRLGIAVESIWRRR